MSPTLSGISGLSFVIPSFYLLPCYSALSCCSFCLLLVSAFGPVSCLLSIMSLTFFLSLEIGFFVLSLLLVVFSGLEVISWSVVSVACYLMALVSAIYAFDLHLNFLMMYVDDFVHVFLNWY